MNNQILHIDLSTEKIKFDQIENQILLDYLGGRGLGV